MTARSSSRGKAAASSRGLMVIDVGNSSTSIGLYARGRVWVHDRQPTASLGVRRTTAWLKTLLGEHVVSGAALASVVPSANAVVIRAVRQAARVETLCIRHDMKLGAAVTYPEPETIGQDRLANLAGAVARYRAPVIVVDIGTATTFDIIHPRKGYTGGIIAPGPALMLEYLAEKTALLPRIDLAPVRKAIGKTTEEAMRLGALHGYRGMVKEIVQYLMKHMRHKRIALCATGGYAAWVLKGMDLPFIYDRDLTLYGIGRIYELNEGDTVS